MNVYKGILPITLSFVNCFKLKYIWEGNSMNIFETIVRNIGEDAEGFLEENMLILFGEDAPPELSDFCYTIEIAPVQREIQTGMVLSFNNTSYKITAVGQVAETNLINLGHITIQFNGATTSEMPGTIYVEEKPVPTINVGDSIVISSN